MSTENKVLKQLQAKKAKLEQIISSDFPYNVDQADAHRRIVAHAKSFLNELTEVIELVSDSEIALRLVKRPTFDKLVEKSDFATPEFEGIYCDVCNICNYTSDATLIIYTAGFDIL